MADLFDKISGFTVAKEAMEMGIYPFFRALSDSEGTTATFEDKDVVMLGSNNYLGLTTDERVREAAIEATRRYGTSVTGSRFLNGTLELHLEADRRLADFVGKEAALVFATGVPNEPGHGLGAAGQKRCGEFWIKMPMPAWLMASPCRAGR